MQNIILHVIIHISGHVESSTPTSYKSSLVGQPLHKRRRVWYHADTQVVPVLMQHLRLCREDLADGWAEGVLGTTPT